MYKAFCYLDIKGAHILWKSRIVKSIALGNISIFQYLYLMLPVCISVALLCSVRGGKLVSVLYDYSQHGDPAIRSLPLHFLSGQWVWSGMWLLGRYKW